MMLPLAFLALAGASAAAPVITCDVRGDQIIVQFFRDFQRLYSEADKFAVVRAATLRGGEWLYVVDDSPPVRFSPYRPHMKRLIIDTRRQLAARHVEATGKRQIVRAFSKPGLYTLVFSDNLMTEPENMVVGVCGAGAVGQKAQRPQRPNRPWPSDWQRRSIGRITRRVASLGLDALVCGPFPI